MVPNTGTWGALVVTKLFLAAIACEALVNLWFHAQPIQGVRSWMIKWTPFLSSQEGHLFDCPYCLSVWVSFLIMAMYMFLEPTAFIVFAGALTIHRLSNFLHLIFSYLRDKQMDLRIQRGK